MKGMYGMLTAIVGINWGDEGKGRMVDLLSRDEDVVVRYQGGNNAGHTVVNHLGKFVLNLLPSGILREEVVCVMGSGMVIDVEHLSREVKKLTDAGVKITPENLKISDKAHICMPYHVMLDRMEEARLKDKKFGSTGRGISPVYGDKYMKKGIRMGDLLHPAYLKERLETVVPFKSMNVEKIYGGEKITASAMYDWLKTYGMPFAPYICDVSSYLDAALTEGKRVMLEAQLGALRDIDFGIYPFTSSSSTIAGYGPVGAGIPGRKIDLTVGIMKAYSSCVGEGPFTVEMDGREAHDLREAGGEYGAATGRPRRVGAFDAVASRYGVRMQGADCLALTKMDVLSYMDRVPVCTAYLVNGKTVTDFPTGEDLNSAEPVIEYLPGWKCDVSSARSFDDLPEAARNYVLTLEKLVGCPIRYVSVGPEREAYIERY